MEKCSWRDDNDDDDDGKYDEPTTMNTMMMVSVGPKEGYVSLVLLSLASAST
jgi:hypothetical protein